MREIRKPKGLKKLWWEIQKSLQQTSVWLKSWSVQRNYRRKIRQLSASHEKVKVVFLVSESAKWNGDSLYQKLDADPRFSPIVLYVPTRRYNNLDSSKDTEYQFFVNQGYNFASISKGAELRAHQPDVVFYQQPWDIQYSDFAPAHVSQYALCLYFPYATATSIENVYTWKDCSSFFKTLYCHFVFNTVVVEQFQSRGVHNTIATGHPKMDAYLAPLKTNPWKDSTKFKIIYAPHHSFGKARALWATFAWNGRELLEWAKTHSETEWLFKPHPGFRYKVLHQTNIMTETELDEYYAEWNRIGSVYTLGDYFDMFRNADLMLTDCGSFLTEWLPTKNPCIHLIDENDDKKHRALLHRQSSQHYYKVRNLEELDAALETVVVHRKDPLKSQREEDATHIKFGGSENIYNYLIQTIWGNSQRR